MFTSRIFQRGLINMQQNLSAQKYKNFCTKSSNVKQINSVMILGGGLEKLQGGIKEEEYFTAVNYSLMSKIREQNENQSDNDYLQNWDEFQKTLEHAPIYESSLMNKHKNCLEEAFFMNETAECCKLMSDRLKTDNTHEAAESELVEDADAAILQNTAKS